MPLSEHEQRMLDQMERALSADDPKFASQMRAATHPRRGRLMVAGLGMLVGLGVAVVGVMNDLIWLGVGGFVVMVAVAAWAFGGTSTGASLGTVQEDGSVQPARGRSRSRRATRATFMQRLEQRWERRRGENTW